MERIIRIPYYRVDKNNEDSVPRETSADLLCNIHVSSDVIESCISAIKEVFSSYCSLGQSDTFIFLIRTIGELKLDLSVKGKLTEEEAEKTSDLRDTLFALVRELNDNQNFQCLDFSGLSINQLQLHPKFFANMYTPNGIKLDLSYAKFVGSSLLHCKFGETILNNASFETAQIDCCDFVSAAMESANFSNSKVTNTPMNDANLFRAKFISAKLYNVNMCFTDLSEADFDKVTGQHMSFNLSIRTRIRNFPESFIPNDGNNADNNNNEIQHPEQPRHRNRLRDLPGCFGP